MTDKEKLDLCSDIIAELLDEIEDLSPAGTDVISQELMDKIENLFPVDA